MEPFMSANSTVTCLRSPSRALFEMTIFSARCLGVYASTKPNLPAVTSAAGAASSSRCPHFLQNFAPSRIAPPQFGQRLQAESRSLAEYGVARILGLALKTVHGATNLAPRG